MKKCEIWVHFPETKNVKMRHFETCEDREEAERIIRQQERHNAYEESIGYLPLNLTYTIEPYGTKKKLGQIVFR